MELPSPIDQIKEDGEPFIIEIGPRNGGNYIPKAIFLNTNTDMTAATVESCLSWNFRLTTNTTRSDKFYACYMIHSREPGVLHDIHFDKKILGNIFEYNPYVTIGSEVKPFYKASEAIGSLILCFDSIEEMLNKINYMHHYCSVVLGSSTTRND